MRHTSQTVFPSSNRTDLAVPVESWSIDTLPNGKVRVGGDRQPLTTPCKRRHGRSADWRFLRSVTDAAAGLSGQGWGSRLNTFLLWYLHRFS